MPHSQPPLVLDKDLEAAVPRHVWMAQHSDKSLLPKVQEQLKPLLITTKTQALVTLSKIKHSTMLAKSGTAHIAITASSRLATLLRIP